MDLGVNYAKSVVKSRNVNGAVIEPELVVVQGGAGTGKSTVIDVLSQHMEHIFRSPGDDPEHPYIEKQHLQVQQRRISKVRPFTQHSLSALVTNSIA